MSGVAILIKEATQRLPRLASRAGRTSLGAAATWVALFAINGLGILPWLYVKFPEIDLAEMVYEVRRVQLGYVPYRDTFTHHFLGYILPFVAIGEFAPLTPTLLKGANILFHFATVVCLFWLLREIGGRTLAWLGAFLAATWGWFWGWQGFGFNIQAYLLPLLSLVLLLLVIACSRASRETFWVAALFGGLLLTFDQRAAAFVPLLAIPPLFVRMLRSPRTICVALAAFAIFPALGLVYLWLAGAFTDFVRQTFVFPVYYRNFGLSGGIEGRRFMLAYFWVLQDPAAALLTLAGSLAVLSRERRVWLKALLLAALAGAGAYAAAGGRFYTNYFLPLAPLTIIVTTMLPRYLGDAGLAAKLASFLIALLILVGVLDPLLNINPAAQRAAARRDWTITSAAAYLRAHTTSADVVLVWGFAPQIYVLSDRFRTFRDAGLLSVAGANFRSTATSAQGRVPAMVTEFNDFLSNTPPRAIIVYRLNTPVAPMCSGIGVVERNLDYEVVPHLHRLRELLAASYGLMRVIQGPCDRADIFLRIAPTPEIRQ